MYVQCFVTFNWMKRCIPEQPLSNQCTSNGITHRMLPKFGTHKTEIWQTCSHFSAIMPFTNYTFLETIGCMVQEKMGRTYPHHLSHLPLAPVPNWLASRPKRQVAIGCFGTEARIWTFLMVVANERRRREQLRCKIGLVGGFGNQRVGPLPSWRKGVPEKMLEWGEGCRSPTVPVPIPWVKKGRRR